MNRLSRRLAYVPLALMLLSGAGGLAKADTVYPTADACYQATQLPCNQVTGGWAPAGVPDPGQGGVGDIGHDSPEMIEHQHRAMEVGVSGTATNPVVAVDMDQVTFPDALPYLDPEVNRVRVPIRFISEQMGAKVEWIQETRTVVITREGLTIELRVDDTKATVNGTTLTLDAPPKLIPPGRVMVPLRFISEAFGAAVDWVGATGPADRGDDWGKYQVWIWIPWGFWGKYNIHDRLEVYFSWYHR